MPDLSPTTRLLQGAMLCTMSGDLKETDDEYSHLQNMRGWMGMIAKRRGIRNVRTFDSGIMGFFDTYTPGNENVLDAILIQTYDGSLWKLSEIELTTVFTYLFATGIKLILQSSDGNWWNCTPDSSTGIISPTIVVTPSSTVAADVEIGYNESYGFLDANGTWKLYCNTDGSIETKRYPAVGGSTSYSADQAFLTGYGPVFQTSDLNRIKLSVDTTGTLITTVL